MTIGLEHFKKLIDIDKENIIENKIIGKTGVGNRQLRLAPLF